MSVLEYIDSDIFSSVFENDIPYVESENIEAICEELFYAIKNRESIFVYGDYDMDGFSSAMVWKEVLTAIAAVPPVMFSYTNRCRSIDKDILRQVNLTDSRVVIICDTGSSSEDFQVIDILEAQGKKTIVIDHHNFMGDYKIASQFRLLFNSIEERTQLHNCAVSGAYACLLVAKVLCDKYLKTALTFNAKVYALASMYSDSIDMSSTFGRALYNSVALSKYSGPTLIQCLNEWNYKYTRRLFSYIVAPKINGCFRMEEFTILNQLLANSDKYIITSLLDKLKHFYGESSRLSAVFCTMFEQERFGDLLLCTHVATEETSRLHIRNYTGRVANEIASKEKCMVVVVVKEDKVYKGSYRDFYDRPLLSTFKGFCNAGGHDSSFGITFNNLNEVKRSLKYLGKKLEDGQGKQYLTLNSGVTQTLEDINAVALYNEYMNVKPKIIVSHKCRIARLINRTTFRRFYEVGLPVQIAMSTSIRAGQIVLLEPCICSSVELREMQ